MHYLGAYSRLNYKIQLSVSSPFPKVLAYETLPAILPHPLDQPHASPDRDGGYTGAHRALPNEDLGHDDDGRHGNGLL